MNLIIKKMLLISILTSLTVVVYFFVRLLPVLPPILNFPPEIHFLIILAGCFIFKKWIDILVLAIFSGFFCALVSGYGLQTAPFDYIVPMISCSIFYFYNKFYYTNIKSFQKNLLSKTFGYSIYIFTILILFLLINLSHTVSGVLFYDFTWKASFIFNAGFTGLGCVIYFLAIPFLISFFNKNKNLFTV